MHQKYEKLVTLPQQLIQLNQLLPDCGRPGREE
jgi:hypothetical protein